MRSRWAGLVFLAIVALIPPDRASAQRYPGGLGRWGWGGWGSSGEDPNAQFMRGLGQFKKDSGQYAVKAAEAEKIRTETILKWNQAMREANRRQQIEMRKRAAEQAVRDQVRLRVARVESGQALNEQIGRILDFPAEGTAEALASMPLPAEILRALPFEAESDSVVFCLAYLTGEEGLPDLLKTPAFEGPRSMFRDAIQVALKEEEAGEVSPQTRSKLEGAIKAARAELRSDRYRLSLGRDEADAFLRSVAAMVQMLGDERTAPAIAELEAYRQGTLADLVAFLHAYNLRLARAQTDRQKQIYRQLYERLAKVPTATSADAITSSQPLEAATRQLGDAAKQVFQNLSWDDLDTATDRRLSPGN